VVGLHTVPICVAGLLKYLYSGQIPCRPILFISSVS
jgi:hypothetical protein